MAILTTILDLIFPVNCASCGKRGQELCQLCFSEYPIAERPTEEWVFPLFDYRHPGVKHTIWFLKYKNRKKLALIFANVLYEKILEEESDLRIFENFRDPILIPIPLSKRRRRERGYNQAEIIAKGIKKISEDRLTLETDVLVKIKETEHQAHIKERHKRLRNLAGSFAVLHPEKIKGKNIILIDDVTTTGATLTEAKKALKIAGAKKIIAFTVAH